MLKALITKKDIIKLSIIKYLERSYQQETTIASIVASLDISEYLLNTTLTELNEDIERYQLTEEFTVEKKGKSLVLKKSPNSSGNILYGYYMRESLMYKLIHSIFTGSFVDLYTFSDEHFVSYANVYRQVQTLKKMLNQEGIDLSSSYAIVGEEEKVRLFYLKLFVNAFNGGDVVFDSPSEEAFVNKLLTLISQTFRKQFSLTTKLHLTYYLKVTYARLKAQKSLITIEQEPELSGASEKFKCIYEALSQVLSETKIGADNLVAVTKQEALWIIAYLISEQFFMPEKADLQVYFALKQDDYLAFQQLNDEFLTALLADFREQPDELLAEALQKNIALIHFKLFYFGQLNYLNLLKLNLDFYRQTYTDSFRFCQDFIQKTCDQSRYSLVAANKEDLLYEYLFLLIHLVPVDVVMPAIKVCVDFSVGNYYNQVITRELQAFQSFRLVITDVLDQDVDLYLSDNMFGASDYEDMETIIWNAPPTAADWKNISNVLLKLKSGKD